MKDIAVSLCCFAFPDCLCPGLNREYGEANRMIRKKRERKGRGDVDDSAMWTWREERNTLWTHIRINKGLICLGSLGTVFLALATAIYTHNPLEMFSKSQLQMREGSMSFNAWKKPPVEPKLKAYVFNYTNTEAFLRGEEKLKVEEIGPYLFTEHLEHLNTTFNANNSLTYVPRRTVKQDEVQPAGDPGQQWVIVPNAMFLGIASYLSDHSFMSNMAFNTFTSFLDSRPFINLTVEQFFWGYDDPLVQIANKILPKLVHFGKFGYIDRMFDEGTNIVTMNLNTVAEKRSDGRTVLPYSIEQYNGNSGLRQYGYDYKNVTTMRSCNTLQGHAMDGIRFPMNVKQNDTFAVYRKSFCRTLAMVYQHEYVNDDGLRAFSYASEEFDDSTPKDSCYCKTKKCLPKGLTNISPCYFDLPIAVSFPHFYGGDPDLVAGIDGLKPSADLHMSTAVLQPDVGLLMRASSKIQSNVVIGNAKYNRKVAPLINTVLPLLWVEDVFDNLPADMIFQVVFLLKIGPVVQTALMLALASAGVVMVTITALNFVSAIRVSGRRNRKVSQVWNPTAGYRNAQIIPILRRESLPAA